MSRRSIATVLQLSLMLLVTPHFAAAGTARADAPARATGELTDAQIVKIVRTANDGEIKQAQQAEKKSANPSVQAFAKMMIEQHEQVNKDLGTVAKAEHIHARGSSDASSLRHDADTTLSSLSSLQGDSFDRAYVNAQVKAHQDVLNSIDNSLLPNAKDAKLQAELQKIRPAVETHLGHAKKLQADLNAAPQTG